MARQAIALIVITAALSSACGCNVCRTMVEDPFGPNTLCDSRRCGLHRGVAACGTECDEGCDVACRPGPIRGRVLRGAPVEACGEPCGDECGSPCGCRRPFGPLSVIFSLFTAGSYREEGRGCSGCGERYWGDWYSDPPECSDPCDQYGNFTGVNSCGCGGRRAAGGMPMSEPAMQDSFDAPMAAPKPGGCRHCGQNASAQNGYPQNGYAQNGFIQNGYAAQPYHPTPRTAVQPSWSPRRPSTPYTSAGNIAAGSSPRIISTTDRAVKNNAEATPHLAQPQRPDVRQE